MTKQTVDIVVRNGRIFTPTSDYLASIAVNDGKIAAIGNASSMPNADRIIDAEGLAVIPGGIDAHVHIGQPWEETNRPVYYEEDVQSATKAAAVSGITTICDMPDSMPLVTSAAVFRRKMQYWSERAYVDFGLHGGFVPGMDFRSLIPDLWKAGPAALKTFTCFSEEIWPAMRDGELLEALNVIHEVKGLAMIHAENDDMLTQNKKHLDEAGRTDFKSHLDWRPPIVEYEADRRVIFLLRETRARGMLVHTSMPEGVEEVIKARQSGQEVYVETAPHYLYLEDSDVEKRGPWVKCSPPLRDKARVLRMRRLLAEGHIDTVGSDHSPFSKEEVDAAMDNMWKAEAGMPALETMLPLLINGVNEGWISLNRVVACLCENPARIYGLYPNKGVILVGSDADIAIIDMKKKRRIRNEDLEMKCKWTPYENFTLQGTTIATIVRGKIVVENSEVVGNEGDGVFAPRMRDTQY